MKLFSLLLYNSSSLFIYGQILTAEDDWCKAEMNGQEGYVPQNYIEIQSPG